MAGPAAASSASVWDVIKRFDAYPKTLEDFRIKTLGGGAITLVSAFVMILLFGMEIRDYVAPAIHEELYVDTSRGEQQLRINIDIVFERIGCDYLGLDAMDVSGAQHLDLAHNIYKRRLGLDGRPLEEPKRETAVGETAKILNQTSTQELVKCGSCYGAETEERKCCNTCQEVKEAYRQRTWKFDSAGVEQCKGENSATNSESEERALKEGCQIYGYLEVNRVGGSFHVAPGKSFSINHIHVHDVQPFSSSDFNLTHRIRHLSFGQPLDLMDRNPLDGVVGVAEKGSMMFQYYLKIVPTTYERKDKSTFASNQFSVTRHQKTISVMQGESGMPGVFFSYELAPVMVKYSERQKSFAHFATGLCAIIGGVFTVAGILDKLVYTSSKILQQKIELGKAT